MNLCIGYDYSCLLGKSQNETKAITLKLLNYIYTYDKSTYRHCYRVARLTKRFLEKIGYNAVLIPDIVLGAYLHDLGKICIDKSILDKKERLDTLETAIMQQHPLVGYGLIESLPYSDITKGIVLHHHEYDDGTGYPSGIRVIDSRIKIVSLMDKFDALVRKRKYQQYYHEDYRELTKEDIKKILKEEAERLSLEESYIIIFLYRELAELPTKS